MALWDGDLYFCCCFRCMVVCCWCSTEASLRNGTRAPVRRTFQEMLEALNYLVIDLALLE